jgi:hypothetical protein
VKAWAALAVVAKKAAVATAAQRQRLAPQPQQRNALRHLHLLKVVLTTWTTTFRSDGATQLAAKTDSRKPVGFFTPVREA